MESDEPWKHHPILPEIGRIFLGYSYEDSKLRYRYPRAKDKFFIFCRRGLRVVSNALWLSIWSFTSQRLRILHPIFQVMAPSSTHFPALGILLVVVLSSRSLGVAVCVQTILYLNIHILQYIVGIQKLHLFLIRVPPMFDISRPTSFHIMPPLSAGHPGFPRAHRFL